MAQQIADLRDIEFVLFEQMNFERVTEHEKFSEFNRKTINMIISEARQLAIKEILPTQKAGDEGCRFENGSVKVPESFHRVHDLYKEGEWLAMADDPGECDGGGMPYTLSLIANEFFTGANMSYMLYNVLTHGAAKLVEEFGSEEQKRLYLKKMMSGKWSGTMLLTEPEAGTDVGALTTSAVKNDDGTYSLTGNKIFISGGEHDLAENIIHPVLARIEGAPEGTRGISLFLVPKYRVDDDGNLGEFNDVVCTGIEEKMGLHGNATASLTLGGKGQCVGTLLGTENKGMSAMFVMMNEARQVVGLQGFCLATTSYLHALDYARERIQSANLLKPEEGGVAIIQHPDVRRQLLIMKAYVEGLRSLIYYSGLCYDRLATSDDETEKARLQHFIEILTPIIKGYGTDKAWEVCSHGVQIFGGYGYTSEYPVEQLLRDCRILMIYEGTNGIQAIDLLNRKMKMEEGKPFMDFLEEIRIGIVDAKSVPETEALATKVEEALVKYNEVIIALGKAAMSDQVLETFAQATPLLDVTGDLVMAWLLLWRAAIAAQALKSGPKKKEVDFYQGQLKTAEFFIHSVLPTTMGKMEAVMAVNGAAVEISEESFGSR
ncbi:MAG: acyl-CoA dehydrogenase [Proteobacteria bacterium]|nr:acyl-CoA dehydrogenase [Pseudomonadota bacterium]